MEIFLELFKRQHSLLFISLCSSEAKEFIPLRSRRASFLHEMKTNGECYLTINNSWWNRDHGNQTDVFKHTSRKFKMIRVTRETCQQFSRCHPNVHRAPYFILVNVNDNNTIKISTITIYIYIWRSRWQVKYAITKTSLSLLYQRTGFWTSEIYIYSADVGAIIFDHDYFSNFRFSHFPSNTGVHNSQYMNS